VRGVNLDTVRGMRFDNQENLSISNLRREADGRSLTFSLEVLGFAIIGPRVLTLESLLGDSTALHDAANVVNIEDGPPEVLTPVISAAVGVTRLVTSVAENTQSVARSSSVGVTRGSLLRAITPNSRSQGSSVTLEISGVGLNNVVSAEFEPAEGITVNEFNVNTSGTSATLSIDITNDATPSIRRLRLLTDSAALTTLPDADRFTITLPRPQITSVSPLLVDRSQTVVPITLRGELLDGASLLTVTPSDGVTASVPIASVDGRSVQASLTLLPDAPLTPRILQLTTPGGVTESLAMLTNTVQVVGSIGSRITPVVSAQIGVIREQAPAPIISSDGTRVTFSVAVDASAPQTARRLELLTADGTIPFSLPASSQLRITGLQPELESIDPIQQVRGASFTMTLRGINFYCAHSTC